MTVSAPPHRMAQLESEVGELNSESVDRALEIDYASSGERLGRLMHAAMDQDMSPFTRIRAATHQQLDRLCGVPSEKYGLFTLAADMATAAEVVGGLDHAERIELRQLWRHLIWGG